MTKPSLRARTRSLQERGFVVWWDRRNMPARALAFTEEIREAIHNSDRVVVVIGPQALRSDYVRAEWQAALSERKPVVTALRLVPEGLADPHSCLPPELKIFHAEPFLAVDGKEPSLDPLERLLSDPSPIAAADLRPSPGAAAALQATARRLQRYPAAVCW